MTDSCPLRRGIIPVLQTPFDWDGSLDAHSLRKLVRHAISGGASGLLAPAVASEVDYLTIGERETIIREVVALCEGEVPFMVGASSSRSAESRRLGKLAGEVGAACWLLAVPQELYSRRERIIPFFASATAGVDLPLMVQDLQFNGPGLTLEEIAGLRSAIPTMFGMKIETVPAGPKYTAVRMALGSRTFIAGGWAVPQMVEALDRGVDAMIPESSMVPIYSRIFTLHSQGRREEATGLLRSLLPVLAYANQDLATSVAFFKRLLVRRGIFATENMRMHGFKWDRYNARVAEELIDLCIELDSTARL